MCLLSWCPGQHAHLAAVCALHAHESCCGAYALDLKAPCKRKEWMPGQARDQTCRRNNRGSCLSLCRAMKKHQSRDMSFMASMLRFVLGAVGNECLIGKAGRGIPVAYCRQTATASATSGGAEIASLVSRTGTCGDLEPVLTLGPQAQELSQQERPGERAACPALVQSLITQRSWFAARFDR